MEGVERVEGFLSDHGTSVSDRSLSEHYPTTGVNDAPLL